MATSEEGGLSIFNIQSFALSPTAVATMMDEYKELSRYLPDYATGSCDYYFTPHLLLMRPYWCLHRRRLPFVPYLDSYYILVGGDTEEQAPGVES